MIFFELKYSYMKKNFLIALMHCTALFFCTKVKATTNDSIPAIKTYHIGIFAPLYLDSVFSTAGNFRYKQAMPKFIMPATDFVNGALIALDSLKIEGVKIVATVYDTKSFTQPMPALIRNKKLEKLDLIIGSVKDQDYKYLADEALLRKIPFISSTYPNDGGITNNPFVFILNSTLKAHCEAIFSYLLQNHGTDKIYICRKKGVQEDKVANYFKTINEQDGKALLPITTILIDSTIEPGIISQQLDSNRQSIIIGGSLEENFAASLTKACFNLNKQYPIMLVGMPNWDGFKSLSKNDVFEDFSIHFTTPFYNTKNDITSKMLQTIYTKRHNGKPTDMTFKGYESVNVFIKLLVKYPTDFASKINDKSIQLFTEYNFKPVVQKSNSTLPDYFENKHLYFIKIFNGNTYKAW